MGKIHGWVVHFERRVFFPGKIHLSGKICGEFLAVEVIPAQRREKAWHEKDGWVKRSLAKERTMRVSLLQQVRMLDQLRRGSDNNTREGQST
jgi:hypothetical protein